MPAFRFCPSCGNRLSAPPGKRPQICAICGAKHYRNSKPCVGAIVVDGDRVLLVKRAVSPFKGWWDIPGGFLELGEDPRVGVIREVREETGLAVEPLAVLDILVDTYGAGGDHTLNIYYLARLLGGRPAAGDDATALGWFAPDALPKRVAFANGRAALAGWRARRQDLASA